MREGEEYVPNISHVFRQDQHLYLLYEVYDPAREKPGGRSAEGDQGRHRSAEQPGTDPRIDEGLRDAAGAGESDQRGGRDAVAVELDVPLAGLKPGSYVCQLNVIDDAGGSFAFPRFAVLVREPAATATPTVPATASAGSGADGTK